jgi:ABC-type nitrate/sulfonate/bicarbonate transport system substrate-binding protein
MKSSTRTSFSRRTVLSGIAATAAAGLHAPAIAQAKRVVKFSLPWVAEGSSLFTYVAKNRGFWAKHGLDVEILRGTGSVAAAQGVATGQFDFSMPAVSASVLQVLKGLPMMMVGVTSYDATQGIGVLADSPIKTPKDLEGRKMASVVSSGEYPFLGLFAERAGFDLSKVDRQQVDVQIRERLLADKQVDAISCFATSAIPALAAKGIETRYMLYSKFGIPNYGNTIVTRPEVVAKDPQLVAAIVDGAMEAIKFSVLNPQEAIDAFFKEVPELAMSASARDQIRIGLGIIMVTQLREMAKDKGLGVFIADDVKAMTELTLKYVVKEGKMPELESLYTNKFVGGVKLSEKEYQTALGSTQAFAKYLA